MKLLGVGLVAAALVSCAPLKDRTEPPPQVTLSYSWLLDNACDDLRGRSVEPEARTELESRLEEFQAAWNNEGPRLLETTVAVTGHPIGFAAADAALVLCGLPSMGFPFIINMRHFLNSTRAGNPDSPRVFVNTVLHELLHSHISSILSRYSTDPTPMQAQYAAEAPYVRNHLHLVAVEEEIYTRLGRQDELDEIQAHHARLKAGPALLRTREIVRTDRTAFLRELREAP